MKRAGRSHLSRRILSMVAAIIAIMTVVLITFHTLHIRELMEDAQESEGITLTESVAGGSELGILSEDPSFLDPIFSSLMNDPGVAFIVAYDSGGGIIHASSRERVDLKLNERIASSIGELSEPIQGDILETPSGEIGDYYAPVTVEAEGDWSESILEDPSAPGAKGSRRTIGLIRIGLSRAELVSAQRNAIIFSVTAAAIVAALGIFISSIVSRRITDPIAKLEGATRKISEGNMEVDFEVASNDEVGSLAGAFNSMVSALKQTTVSKDYVDSIVSSMNDSLFVISPDRTISSINRAASDLLGYEPGELEGRSVDELFASGNPVSADCWEEISRGESLSNADALMHAKGGGELQVSVSVAPMFDSRGKMRGAVCVARDISEIQRLLIQLRGRSEELEQHRVVLTSMLEDNDRARATAEAERQKTQAAVDSMGEGLIMFGASGELLLINPAARRILHLEEDDEADSARISKMLGVDLSSAAPQDGEEGESGLLQDAVLGETVKHTIRIEGIPIGDPGMRSGLMLVMRDVTRERQLDEAKHELLTNVSHELRTPLAAISNILSNALVGVTGAIGEKLRAHLEIARLNTKRLANIIDNLLDIASLDAGSVTIRREPADFISIVEEVTKSLDIEMQQKAIRLDKELPAEPIIAYCDPAAISQVVRNLLSNAIRFSPQEGIVGLSIKHSEDRIEVAVSDSGTGIPLDEQRSVFERFHQVGRTYGPGEKGLGLGLSISRHLVELHGGSIGLKSAPNKGSRFSFFIPIYSGGKLLETYLGDRISEMAKGGAVPYLWSLTPACAGSDDRPPSEELMEVALERLESVVREMLQGTRHIVCHPGEGEDVTAVVIERTAEEADRQAEKIEKAIGRFSFTYDERRVVCSVSIGRVACLDPSLPAVQYMDQARKSAKRRGGEERA
ncbi:MAG TPA: ATP-binding protein [bacterium]|nr:ATP-binding protein [bacterium]